MNVEVFAICYNEEYLMPFFMKHYAWAKVNIYDNHSTDRSREIAEAMGAKVHLFGGSQLDDREYLKIKNEVYKHSKADYVIVSDLDEFLYHPQIVDHLKYLSLNGVTMPNVRGFNIYSESLPESEIKEIDTGFEDVNFSKQIIFSPKININFSFGCHHNSAQGRIVRGGELALLHYRCIGGVQNMIDRHKMYKERMCEFNKMYKLGGHYFRTAEEIRKEWNTNIGKSKKLRFYV